MAAIVDHRRSVHRTPSGGAAVLLGAARGRAYVALVYLGGEAQRVDGFGGAVLSRRHVDEHQRFAVAAQGVLQEVCQLGVPERHILLLWGQKGSGQLKWSDRMGEGGGRPVWLRSDRNALTGSQIGSDGV